MWSFALLAACGGPVAPGDSPADDSGPADSAPEPDDTSHDTSRDTSPDTSADTSDTGDAPTPPGPAARWAGEVPAADALPLLGWLTSTRAGHRVALGDYDGDGAADVLLGAPDDPQGAVRGGTVWWFAGPIDAGRAASEADARLSCPTADDQCGWDLAAAGDLDGDGVDDFAAGVREGTDGSGRRGEGEVWVVHGPIDPTAHDFALVGRRWVGEGSDYGAGEVLAGVGDVSGDGLPDLAVGSPRAVGGGGLGTVYLLHGPADGSGSLLGADVRIPSDAWGSSGLGATITGLADVDGDGVRDLAVGQSGWEGEDPGVVGAAFVLSGASLVSTVMSDLALATVTGEAGALVGAASDSLAGADLDRDGYADLVVGTPDAEGGAGALHVFAGGPLLAGARPLAGADSRFTGAPGDGLGGELAGELDLDGDGYEDLLAGVPDADAGGVYLIYGPADGVRSVEELADARLVGGAPGDRLGTTPTAGLDLTGDGVLDLLVGAEGADGETPDAGRALIFPGAAP